MVYCSGASSSRFAGLPCLYPSYTTHTHVFGGPSREAEGAKDIRQRTEADGVLEKAMAWCVLFLRIGGDVLRVLMSVVTVLGLLVLGIRDVSLAVAAV